MNIFSSETPPGHVLTFLKLNPKNKTDTAYLALDGTLVQFEDYPFFKTLQSTKEGQEIVDELRALGFWAVTQPRYEVLVWPPSVP